MGWKDGAKHVEFFLDGRKMEHHLSQLGEGHVLLDASGMLHAVLSTYAQEITEGNWVLFDRDIAARLRVWTQASEGIIPILVFDGHRCEAKRANADRKAERDEAHTSIPAINELIAEMRKEFYAIGLEEGGQEKGGGEVSSSPPAPLASTEDADSRRLNCKQRVTEAIKKLKKYQQKAVGRYATDAAYRMLRMCADRGIGTIVAAGEAEHTMAALYALSRAGKSIGLNVRAVCGYDSDFFVLQCPVVLFGQGLQGVLNRLDYEAADAALRRKTDYQIRSFSTQDSKRFVSAMVRYGTERVMQLTAVFSDNDYVQYRGIGPSKLAAAWRHMLDTDVPVLTLGLFAKSLAAQFPRGTSFDWLKGKSVVHELVRRAERAAFMFHGQPVLHGTRIWLPEMPDWTEGCCSQLFRAEPMSGYIQPRTVLSYELRRPSEDGDVLELVQFFNAFTAADIRRPSHRSTFHGCSAWHRCNTPGRAARGGCCNGGRRILVIIF